MFIKFLNFLGIFRSDVPDGMTNLFGIPSKHFYLFKYMVVRDFIFFCFIGPSCITKEWFSMYMMYGDFDIFRLIKNLGGWEFSFLSLNICEGDKIVA